MITTWLRNRRILKLGIELAGVKAELAEARYAVENSRRYFPAMMFQLVEREAKLTYEIDYLKGRA